MENGFVHAETTHFTEFALIGAPPAPVKETPQPLPTYVKKPATFQVSDFTVTPGSARTGETVTVSALVTNTGGSAGTYNAVLRINGIDEAEKELTLGINESKTVTFNVRKETKGIYEIEIAGLKDSFTVFTETTSAVIEEEQETAPPDEESGPSFRWVFGTLISTCVIALGFSTFFIIRRKGKYNKIAG